MGEKSLQKRNLILEESKKVFIEKGFMRVSMKDIVEACGISRGGLYLYFNSTSEIFLEIIKEDNRKADEAFKEGIAEDATAAEILILFLKAQKREILNEKESLTQAIYEFYFENDLPKKDNILKKQFDSCVKIMEKLIETGVDNEEMICEDCHRTARTIAVSLEGLRIMAQTIGITSDVLDQELIRILQGLGIEDSL